MSVISHIHFLLQFQQENTSVQFWKRYFQSCSAKLLPCCKSFHTYNMFAGSEPPKFRGSPNISLTKYQLSVFLCLLFAEKINSLLVNQQKISQLKLVLRSWKKSKQNLVKKIFGDHQILWWFGSREHVNRLKKLFEDTKVKIRSESRTSAICM